MRITYSCYQKLIKITNRNRPYEACALLFSKTQYPIIINSIQPIKNMIKSPFGFGIHHNDFIRVIKEKSKKLKFVGIFHSHPHENANSELSGWDINMIRNNPELIFLIGLNGSINEFRLFFYFYCKTKKIINSREII